MMSKRIDLLLTADTSGHDELPCSQFAKSFRGRNREALHQSFAVDMSVEKRRGVGLKLRNGIIGSQFHLSLPTFDRDTAILGVDPGYHALGAHCGGEISSEIHVHCALF